MLTLFSKNTYPWLEKHLPLSNFRKHLPLKSKTPYPNL